MVGREGVVGEGKPGDELTLLIAPESEDDAGVNVGRFLKTRGILAPKEVFGVGTGRGATVEGEMGEGTTMFTFGTPSLEVSGACSRVGVEGGD